MVAWCVLALTLGLCAGSTEELRRGEWRVVSAVSVASVSAPHNASSSRLLARLTLTEEWASSQEQLLRFQLSQVQLQDISTRPRADWSPRSSVWTQYGTGTGWARLALGRITHVYLNTDQPHYYTNYERALISLFQFQVQAQGEFHNETDVTGECSGFYEQMAPHVYRKIKRSCEWEGDTLSASAEEEDGVTSRRITRVEFPAGVKDILGADLIVSEEETRAGGAEGVRVRASHRLERVSGSLVPPAAPAPLTPPAPPLPLSTLLPHLDPSDEQEPQEELVKLVAAALARVAQGTAFVEAALAVLPALDVAGEPALEALLHHHWDEDQLVTIYRLLGLSGSAHTWRVCVRALALGAPHAHPLSHVYLQALGGAAPHHDVLSALVAQCGAARDPGVRCACVGAVGGAARGVVGAARQAAVAYLLTALNDCKDEELCVSAVSGAGAARCDACAAALRRVVTHGTHTHARILACGVMSEMLVRVLGAETLRALERVALALDRDEPIEVRGAALATWLRVSARAARSVGAGALQHDVTLLFQQLARHGPAELYRVAWQQLEALAEEEEGEGRSGAAPARAHVLVLRAAPALHNYYQPGMSYSVRRAAWRVAGREVAVRGVAVSRRGVLRDARVSLRLLAAGNDAPLAALQLRTQGMHHVAAETPSLAEKLEPPVDEEESSSEEEEPSAWLGVEAWGHAHVIPLFTSKGALAAAVWSGAGAEWTRVRRAVRRERRQRRRAASLLGAALLLGADTLADMSLHAHAQVSLWSRSALVGGGAALAARRAVSARVVTAWGAARARRTLGAAGALRVQAAADFYQDVAVCAAPALQPLTLTSETVVEGRWGGRGTRRTHVSHAHHAARCVPLGADNDRQCRTLHHAHTDTHDETILQLEALAY